VSGSDVAESKVLRFLMAAARARRPELAQRIGPANIKSQLDTAPKVDHAAEAFARLHCVVLPMVDPDVRADAETAFTWLYVEDCPLIESRYKAAHFCLLRAVKEHLQYEPFPAEDRVDIEGEVWTRQAVAEKLGMTVQGVAKVAERERWRSRSEGTGRGRETLYRASDVVEYMRVRADRLRKEVGKRGARIMLGGVSEVAGDE
jgi:hypothetical protein